MIQSWIDITTQTGMQWRKENKTLSTDPNKGYVQEYKKRKTHAYQTGDKVLLRNAWKTKFNQNSYLDPYVTTAVRNNGTVGDRKGRVMDTFDIWNLTPYKE